MRARPLIWIALGVVALVGLLAGWRLLHRPVGQTPTPGAASSSVARLHRVAATNAWTVAAATAPALLTGQAAAGTKPSPLVHRLRNTTRTSGELLHDDHAVLLENALIDTSRPLGFSIPEHLRAGAEPGSYIVQARGPVDDAFRATLAAAGVTIVSYIPNNAFLVRASATAAAQLQVQPQTQAVLVYEPVYKLKGDLLGLGLTQQPLPPEARLNVMAFSDGRAGLLGELQQRGWTVLGETASPFGPVFTVAVAEGQDWVGLAQLPGVELIEKALVRRAATDLSRVQVAVATDSQVETNYLNLTGTNVLVVMADSGVSTNHPDLVNRVLLATPALGTDPSGHGTSVAGIIAGNGAESLTVTNVQGSINPGTNYQYRGMAPGARLYVQSSADSDQVLQEGAARTNALIANNSWNYAVNTYNIAAASYDAAVRDALPGVTGSQPVLFVFSAGNEGDGNNDGLSGDPESILSPGTAKNVITVGAIELARDITNVVTRVTDTSTNTTTPWKGLTSSGNEVAAFSSRGNVGIGVEGDFGRFKPDVVAPGTFVVTTRSTTWDESAYYNPTIHHFENAEDQVIATNGVNNYSIFLPANTVGFSIALVPNQDSPMPFPNLPIFVRRADIPALPSTYDFVKTNAVNVPPDGGGLGGNVGQNWYYSIANVTTQEVQFDIVTDYITIDQLGDYYEVLSNLNNSISGVAPNYYRYESGTSMSAAEVSGTLALMQEFFEQRLQPHVTNSPALLKALLINGARSVGSLYDYQVQNTINFQGWGLIKLANSLPESLTNYTTGLNTVSNAMLLFDQSPTNALATGQSQTRTITLNEDAQTFPLRMTLVWTDPPGNPVAGVKLVNDLDLIVTNLDTGEVFFGNDIPVNSIFTYPWDTNAPVNVDAVNNVENVYLAPSLGSNYAVTVFARHVNVNAVTAQANNVVQDYALVISSGNGEVPDALHLETVSPVVFTNASLYPELTPITNQYAGNPTVGGGILLGQHVGANTPLLGTTNGMTNQWHFYVITNTVGFTNAAFVTFLPPTLSLPRGGIFADPAVETTRVEADIDLYVSRDFNLTNLTPAAVAAADKSRTRGGTEFVAYTNSALNDVYYIGVKSEDYMAAEYAIFGGFSLLPFTTGDGFGNWIVNGFPLPSVITDGSPSDPGASLVLGLSLEPASIRRLIVTNSLYHENLGDLVGVLSHSQKFAVLNNHRSALPGTFIYEDNDEEPNNPVLRHSDGPGNLRDFVGDEAVGVWLLTTVDNSQSQTGAVTVLSILIEPSDTSGGDTNTIRANSFFYEVVDVPVGATNLQICVDLVSPNPLPVELYVRYGDFPARLAYDHYKLINPPGSCLDITPFDLPPLRPGRYYIGAYNPNGIDQDVVLRATVSLDPRGVVPINWAGAGNQPILDDAVENYTQFVTNNAEIAQLEVGLRIDHPRVSDLAVTLISPHGTRVLLVENRGGTTTSGFGNTLYVTNFVPVAANGSNQPQTTVIDTGATAGSVTIDYNFYDVPDQMTVYYQGGLLWDSGMITGVGRRTLTYGPGVSTQVTIVVNEFGNTNTTTLWDYSVSSISSANSYLTFTESTNLTTTPIKFLPPPFLPTPAGPPVGISDFEWPPTINGNYFGPLPGAPDGWNVMSTDPVTVVSNPPAANTGLQSLALRSGQLLRNLPTTPGRSYRLNYAYRQVPNLDGLVSWWPAELTPNDVVGTNNGVLAGGAAYDAAEVGSGFLLNNSSSAVIVPASVSLNVGLSSGFSIESWINPANVQAGTASGPVAEWTPNNGTYGVHFYASAGGIGTLYANIVDTANNNHVVQSAPGLLVANTFQHVALTFDKLTGMARLYCNGVMVQQALLGFFTPKTSTDLYIGYRTPATPFGPLSFKGIIDDLTLYNRALTVGEIANIYAAGASGKFGMMFPPDDDLVSTNYPYRRSPVGAQIYVPGQVTNSFLGDTNWQPGGLIFQATSNLTAVGLSPVVTGNHYYQFIRTNISWQNARALAASFSTNGLTAHLATITSAAENDFLRLTFATNQVNEFVWIGGRETLNNGAWYWDVGPEANLPFSTNNTPVPPFNYVNWGPGEPSNSRSNEDYLMFNIGTNFNGISGGQWADAVPTNSAADPVVGLLVEFEPIPPIQSGVMVDSFTLQEASAPLYALPEESLDALRGENAYGLWQLEIWDSRTGATNQVLLLDWQLQFVFVTNSATARGLRPCEPVTTSIPPGRILYYTVDVPAAARFATNLLFNASGPVNFYFNQTMAPGFGVPNPGDIVFTNNATDCTRITSADGVSYPPPPLLPGQRYYLAIENQGTTNVTYTLQVCFDLSVIPPAVVLSNGVANCTTNLTPLGIDYYRFTVSTNARRAQFEIANPSGDMTLLVRRGLPPTFAVFDYFSANTFTNEELVTVFDYSSPVPLTPGDWYLGAANLTAGPVTYCIKATEWTEYGTNLVITNWFLSSNSFCLTWTSLPGVKYVVEGVPDLTSTNWVAASPTLTATDYATTYCISLPSPLHFFRVREGLALDAYVPPPVITRIQRVLTGFLLSWSGPASAQYNVQWTPTLVPPPPVVWTTFTNPPTVTSVTGLFQFLDTGAETGGLGPLRFYRLLLLP